MQLFEAVARYLSEERGGRPVFGLMGDANLGYIGAFIEEHQGNYVAAALESGAVLMGDGWTRSTRGVSVVSVTHGPALTNTLTPLVEAVRSRTSMVLLTGSTPGLNDHFQYMDSEGFARLAGADYLKVRRATDVLAILDRAFVRAEANRLPVILDIPFDVLRDTVQYRSPQIPPLSTRGGFPNESVVEDSLELLLAARRPLLIVGRGAVAAGARDDLLSLSRALNAPLMTTLLAKDYFDGEPENLGVHGGLSTPTAVSYIDEADVVMSFGASLNNFTTDYFSMLSAKSVMQVDVDPVAFSRFGPVTHAILSDARAMARAMLERLKDVKPRSKRAVYMDILATQPYREAKDLYVSTTGGGYVDMRDATSWLSSVLPEGAQQVCDVGRFSYSTWPHIRVDPDRWFYAGAFGSIGLGTGVAIGAAMGRPDVPTALYVGDGGAMQGIAELHTAVRNNVPLIIMVLNDNCYGAEYRKLEDFGSSPERSMIEWSSFAGVARSLGLRAVRATSMDDLELAAELIGAEQLPLLIEVIADPNKVTNTPGIAPVSAPDELDHG